MSIANQFYHLTKRRINKLSRIAGGDICEAYRATLQDKQTVFIKTHRNGKMLVLEASGLNWLRQTKTISIPKIIAVEKTETKPGLLALEWIDNGQPCSKNWEELGRLLAFLHRKDPGFFGLRNDNFLGHLTQVNTITDDWANFFRNHRLLPQIKMAIEQHRAPISLQQKCAALLQDLENRLGQPNPSYLHGDLWSGNHLFSTQGTPYLIDPAAYAGHREVDIAMMKLFGGYPENVFAAYQEVYPLEPGWQNRILIYQLYYLLAHVNLHGSGWLTSVFSLLQRLG